MSGSGNRPGNRDIWAGALTIVLVVGVVVWTLRLLAPWEVHPSVSITDVRNLSGLVIITIGAYAGVCLLVASQWSNRWMRVTGGLLAVTALLLIVRSGRAELDHQRLRLARVTAANLAVELDELSASAEAKANELRAYPREAYDAAHRVLADRVGSDQRDQPRPSGCDPPTEDVVESTLCDISPVLERALRTPGPHAAELKVATDRLAALLTAETVSEGDRVRIGAFVEAGAAIEAANRPPTSPLEEVEEARESVEAFCEAANGSPPPTCRPLDPPVPPEVKPDDPQALSLLSARAEREVAAANVAVDRTDVHIKELADADAALAKAQAEQGDPPPTHDLATVVTAGAERLARSVPGIGGDRIPLGLGPLGWGLLGGLGLVGCRWLEIVSRDRSRGLVKINPMEPVAGDAGLAADNAKVDTAFRRHVLSNVSEPGAIPGGTTPGSVTDLLGAADPTGRVEKVVAAISAVTAVTPGFELDATYQRPETVATNRAEGDGGAPGAEPEGRESERECHRVFIRVRKARTGATLRTKLVTATTASLAARSAGYWAAAYILSRDSTAPSWVRWPEGSAVALAEYDEAVEGADDDDQDKLRLALALAPGSGLLLSTLASALELSGKTVEALELHIRAATHHPRYPHARYRLAMSLSNLAARDETWTGTPLPDKRRISQALVACARACDVKIDPLPEAPTLRDLLVAAEAFRKATGDMFGVHRVAVHALRRSERRYWAPMLFTSDQRLARRRTKETMESSSYVLRERLARAGGAGVTEEPSLSAGGARGWQTLYNLACFYAVRSNRTGADDRLRAVELLERLLFERDTGGQLTQEWVDRDPDLENLRANPRFLSFRLRLPDKPSPDDRREQR